MTRVTLPTLLILIASALLWWLGPLPGPVAKTLGQWSGWLGFTAFSLTLLFSLRVRLLDRLADGLDKTYRLHHWLGLTTYCLLLAHVGLLSFRWLAVRPGKAFWFPFPVHPRVSVNLGSYAFWLLTILIGLTLWRRFPYRQWRLSHKLIGIPFLLAILHVWLSDRNTIDQTTLLFTLFLTFAALGASTWLYDLLALRRWHPLKVKALKRPTPRHLIVTADSTVALKPGQYLFARFAGHTREAHPFTPWENRSNELQFAIKTAGDYTEALHKTLKVGTPLQVSRPYGTFDYQRGLPRQVWVAGGVGIAPFLAFAEAIARGAEAPQEIHLFYCYHDEKSAYLAPQLKNLPAPVHLHLIPTGKEGHLTAQQIASNVKKCKETTLFLCGPPPMVRDLTTQAKRLGWPRHQIHSEAFAFRN
jgi:predicted ferric reductase